MSRKQSFLYWLILAFVLFPGFNIQSQQTKRYYNRVENTFANLTIYWIDTEGGAATLIVTPSGESVLIDTGNPGGRDSDRIYEVASNVAGLKKIDHLITTHWHIDHYGGAALLSAKIPIIEVIDKGIPDSLTEDKKFAENIQAYRNMAVKLRSLIKPGAVIKLNALPKGFEKMALRFVGANKQFVPITKTAAKGEGCERISDKAVDNTDNANSMVLVMDYGPFRVFN